MNGRRIFIILISLLFIFASVLWIYFRVIHIPYYKTIKDIAEEYGYSMEETDVFESNNSYFSLEKEGLDHITQVAIERTSYNESPDITIYISREIDDECDIKDGLDKHFDLIVGLINEFSEKDISSNMFNTFFENDDNVILNHEFDEYGELYYAVKKADNLNEMCGILYEVYTFAHANEKGEYMHLEEDDFDEQLTISTIEYK